MKEIIPGMIKRTYVLMGKKIRGANQTDKHYLESPEMFKPEYLEEALNVITKSSSTKRK